MALRISFESDVKGFERVQKALEAQQELLNANAEAVERLNNAQQGLSKTSLDTKSSESIRATASHIKDLTGSLETLNKTQAGLKGFMASFTEFGKQIAQIKSESSGQIFKSMSDQMDTLKTNMRAAGFEMDNLRVKMNAAKASGNREEEAALGSRMNQLRAETIANNGMKNQLGDYMFWNQPRIGGASFSSMAGMAMRGGVAGLAGVALAGKIGSIGQNYLEQDTRAENAMFSRELGIGQAAAGGNIGRQSLLGMGIGAEAAFLDGGTIFDRLQIGSKFLLGGGQRSYQELVLEHAQQKAALDVKRTYGLDKVGGFMLNMAGDPRYSAIERIQGQSGARGFMQKATASGLTSDQSIDAISMASRYGYSSEYGASLSGNRANQVSPFTAQAEALRAELGPKPTMPEKPSRFSLNANARREYNAEVAKAKEANKEWMAKNAQINNLTSIGAANAESDYSSDYYSRSFNLNRGAESLDMDEISYAQANRQRGLRIGRGASYEEASRNILGDLGEFKKNLGSRISSSPDAMKAAQSYLASLQANAIGPAGASDLTTGMTNAIQGATATSADFRSRSGSEQVALGATAQQAATSAPAFSFKEQLYQGAMSRLGIPMGMERIQLLALLDKNQDEKAVKIMSQMIRINNPKLSDEEAENMVRKEFGFAQKSYSKAMTGAFGVRKSYQAAFEAEGLGSGIGMAATGDASAAMGAAFKFASENRFQKPGIIDASGKMKMPGDAPAPKPTTQQEIDKSKSELDNAMLLEIKKIEAALGSGAVTKQITDGYIKLIQALQESVDKVIMERGNYVNGGRP